MTTKYVSSSSGKKKHTTKSKTSKQKALPEMICVFGGYVWGTMINNSHVFTIIVYKKQWGDPIYSHLWDEENGKCDKKWLSMLPVVRQILRAGVPMNLGSLVSELFSKLQQSSLVFAAVRNVLFSSLVDKHFECFQLCFH